MKRYMKISIVVAFTTVLILLIGLKFSNATIMENMIESVFNSMTNIDEEFEGEVISTTANDLVNEYKENIKKANKKYSYSEIKIEGTIKEILYNHEYKDTIDYIVLDTRDKKYEVQLSSPFDNDEEMSKLETYKVGDKISVLGYFDDGYMEYEGLNYLFIDIDKIISK